MSNLKIYTFSFLGIFAIVTFSSILCPENCIKCPNKSICTECSPSFILNKNICVKLNQKSVGNLRPLAAATSKQPNILTQSNKKGLVVQKSVLTPKLIRFGGVGDSKKQKCVVEQKGVCIMCGDKFQMGIGGQCIEKIEKCLLQKGKLCIKCNNRFSLQKGQCLDLGCQGAHLFNCNKCKIGYKLNNYSFCEVQNCNQYSQGYCKNCLNGFMLEGQFCISSTNSTNVTDCQVFNQNNTCQKCQNEYFLVQGKCQKLPKLCIQLDKNNKCIKCRSPNLQIVGEFCIDNKCNQREEFTNQCKQCKKGYQLNQNKICVEVSNEDNCKRRNSKGCVKCKENYYLTVEGICKQLPENCLDQNCRYCKPTFISFNKKCQNIENCLNFTGNVCEICQENYALTIVGSCVRSVPNCLQYNYTGCSKCPPNYQNTNKSCQVNKKYKDPNCISFTASGKCISCKKNFRLQPKYNNLCLEISNLCKTSGKSGQCLSCYDGYQLNNFTGGCSRTLPIKNCMIQKNGLCQKCSQRFYMLNRFTCKQVDQLCKDYHEKLGYCLSCYPGYDLDGNFCQPQIIQIPLLNNGGVEKQTSKTEQKNGQQKESNCKKSDPLKANKCLICNSNYHLDKLNFVCIKNDPFCKKVNQNGQCQNCYDGYTKINQKCQLFSLNMISFAKNCKKIDITKRQCVQCNQKYFKSENQCQEVSPLCSKYNNLTGDCTSCYKGYLLSGKVCIPQILPSNCEKTNKNASNLKCQKCLDGYILKGEQCERLSALCAKWNQQMKCQKCIEGYYLNKVNQCLIPSLGWDQSCEEYNQDGYCSKCKQNKRIDNYLCR